MRKFKHVNTGEELSLNSSHSALSVVENSPSWKEVVEEVPKTKSVAKVEKNGKKK